MFHKFEPTDVASRQNGVKKLETQKLWFGEPEFLKPGRKVPICESPSVFVNRFASSQDNIELCFPKESFIDRTIESSPSFYIVTKRVAYLPQIFKYLAAKSKIKSLFDQNWTRVILDKALIKNMGFE